MASLRIPTDDVFEEMESAVAAGNAPAFAGLLQSIDWPSRPPVDFLRATKLALEVGAYTIARHLANQGLERHPHNPDIQKYAAALELPKITRRKASFDPTIKANRDWLAEHGDQYRGRWVGLRNGELLGSADSFDELVKQIGNPNDVLVTTVY